MCIFLKDCCQSLTDGFGGPHGPPRQYTLSGEYRDRKRQWVACSYLWGQVCFAEKERTDSSNRIWHLKQKWVWKVLGLSIRTSENKSDYRVHSPSECRTNVLILLPLGSFLEKKNWPFPVTHFVNRRLWRGNLLGSLHWWPRGSNKDVPGPELAPTSFRCSIRVTTEANKNSAI